jgi:hypothetical protein
MADGNAHLKIQMQQQAAAVSSVLAWLKAKVQQLELDAISLLFFDPGRSSYKLINSKKKNTRSLLASSRTENYLILNCYESSTVAKLRQLKIAGF